MNNIDFFMDSDIKIMIDNELVHGLKVNDEYVWLKDVIINHPYRMDDAYKGWGEWLWEEDKSTELAQELIMALGEENFFTETGTFKRQNGQQGTLYGQFSTDGKFQSAAKYLDKLSFSDDMSRNHVAISCNFDSNSTKSLTCDQLDRTDYTGSSYILSADVPLISLTIQFEYTDDRKILYTVTNCQLNNQSDSTQWVLKFRGKITTAQTDSLKEFWFDVVSSDQRENNEKPYSNYFRRFHTDSSGTVEEESPDPFISTQNADGLSFQLTQLSFEILLVERTETLRIPDGEPLQLVLIMPYSNVAENDSITFQSTIQSIPTATITTSSYPYYITLVSRKAQPIQF